MLNKQTQKITKFAAVILLLVFFHFIGVLAPIESFIAKATKPILSGFYSAGSSLRVAYNQNTNKSDLNILVEQLTIQVEELTAENARLEILK